MKKLGIIALLLAMVFTFAACDNNNTNDMNKNDGVVDQNDNATKDGVGGDVTGGGTVKDGDTLTDGTTDNNLMGDATTTEDFMVAAASDDMLDSFSRIFTTGDSTAGGVLIWGKDTMKKVRVTSGTYQEDAFTEDKLLHEEETIMPGEAMLVKVSLPEDVSSLRVSYQDDAGQEKSYVVRSRDGKLEAVPQVVSGTSDMK